MLFGFRITLWRSLHTSRRRTADSVLKHLISKDSLLEEVNSHGDIAPGRYG